MSTDANSTIYWFTFSTVMAAILMIRIIDVAGARDRNVALEFQRIYPCPSTGERRGSCPGYVRDHIIPLCMGGEDTVENMQWQTVYDAKIKDRTECKHGR